MKQKNNGNRGNKTIPTIDEHNRRAGRHFTGGGEEICNKIKQFVLKLTFPDQSHYNQSRLWSRLHTTRAQITRITLQWIYTEYTVVKIFSPFRIFEQLAPWKTEFALKLFTVFGIFFYHSGFLSNFSLALKNRVCLKFFAALNILFTFRILGNLRLTWKTEFALNSLYWIYIFLSFRIFEQLAFALKNRVAQKIFTVMKYMFTFRIFEQLALALRNRVFPGAAPASYASDEHNATTSNFLRYFTLPLNFRITQTS